jgi:hypothetical protein
MIVTIDKFRLLGGGLVPPELQGYITQDEYSLICTSYQECEAGSHCLTCACEAGVCICTGFVFIFFAHPCVSCAVADYIMAQ